MNSADPSWLAQFWAGVLFLALFVYVTLDGFDLGVGILFGTTRDHKLRSEMMGAIAPFWNGNETWLIAVGATLFAAFPAVYGVFLAAFYIPVLLLLVGLIFRGVAFEFRGRGGPAWIWDWGFFLGSTIVAFVQGAAVGALMDGVPVHDNQFDGGSFDWLRPFPVLCGVGLNFGYGVLGAGWLVLKSEGKLRDWAYARIPSLVGITVALLGLAGVGALMDLARVAPQHMSRTWALFFPIVSALAAIGTIAGVRLRRDGMPFAMATLSFAAAFLTVPAMFWPYMIPYQITVASAAAPDASLSFLFWGAGVVALPIIAVYTAIIYWSFRGKMQKTQLYGSAGLDNIDLENAEMEGVPATEVAKAVSKIGNGLLAGSIATVFLSILLVVKSTFGILPRFNLIDDTLFIVDMFLGDEVPPLVGWILHFLIGVVVWGTAYAFLSPRLPGRDVVKGLLFGAIAWLVMMVTFMPAAADGFFALVIGPAAMIAALGFHLIYGAVLGASYGRLAARNERPRIAAKAPEESLALAARQERV